MRDILSPLSGFPTPWVRCRGSIAAPAWTPAALFANGEYGAWFDPSDLSTLFQDAAGTIPVTSPGDPVGLMLDKSGNDLHVSQSTASMRPTYQTNGYLHWLSFDGVDDFLRSALVSPEIPQPTTHFLAVATPSDAPSSSDLVGGVESFGQMIQFQSTNLRAVAGLQVSYEKPRPFSPIVGTYKFNLASSLVRENGADKASGDVGTRAFNGVTLGARYTNGAISIMDTYGYIVVEGVPDFSGPESYLANKSGVIL